MVCSTVAAAGGDASKLVASSSSVKRHRKVAQHDEAEKIKLSLKEHMPKHKVIHWDGKLVEFVNQGGGGVHQDVNATVLNAPLALEPRFLGAPVVARGTGALLCEAVINILQEWGALDGVIATCWDTTASNTGCHEGAVTHFEAYLEHAFLWLACRHHMAELHVKHVYDKIRGATKGIYVLSVFKVYIT